MRSAHVLGLSAAALLLTLAGTRPVAAKEAGNVVLTAPERWRFVEGGPEWSKSGIVMRALRELETLKGGARADGEGAEAVVYSVDPPAGKSLDEIAADPEVRKTLLGRFGEKEADWPKLQVEQMTLSPDTSDGGGEVPAVLLRGQGTSPNLKGNKTQNAEGVLILAVVRKKLIKVRIFAWPTKHDDENLKTDTQLIEIQGITLINTKEEKVEKKPDPGNGGGAPPPAEKEEEKEQTIENIVLKFRVRKAKGLPAKEIDHNAFPTRQLWLEESVTGGTYQLIFEVLTANAVDAQGNPLTMPEARSFVSTQWWNPSFQPNHPMGAVLTYEWPRRSTITLPAMDKPIVVFKADEKRWLEPSYDDMEKKGICEKLKKVRLGKGEPNEFCRGSLQGNRPGAGQELLVRFAWRTVTHGYRIIVALTGDYVNADHPKFKALKETLESIEILEK